MTLFDLIFIAWFLASAAGLFFAGLLAVLGRRSQAGSILKVCAVSAVVYLLCVAIVSYAAPRRVLSLGQPLCFDDWCISTQSAQHQLLASGVNYLVTLHLYS